MNSSQGSEHCLPTRPRRVSPPLQSIPVLVVACLGVLAGVLAGCGGGGTLQAETREVALTHGPGVRVHPCYSPDGREVAYTEVEEGDRCKVYVVSSTGGEPRRVSNDDGECVLGWMPDGRGLFVTNRTAQELRTIDLNGDSLKTVPKPEMAWIRAVSRNGTQFLWAKFTGDNLDLDLSTPAGTDHVLAQTPEWESQACFGPEPGEITVSRQTGSARAVSTELAVWSPKTGSYTPLPIPPARNLAPAWSPDHRYLAYASDQGGNLDIWLYDPGKGANIQLTNTREEENQPAWSPDGRWIAFSRGRQTSHIFVGNPETYEKRQITSGEAKDTWPVPSPDGKFVAFIRRSPSASGIGMSGPGLCVVSAEGGEVRRLDLDDLVPEMGEGRMSWSPDGTQLAFSADDGTGNVDIYRIRLDGGQPERVTIRPGSDVGPRWSPDGKFFAYNRLADGETQISVIPVLGGMPTNVTHGESVNQAPAWGPDSDHIAYSRTDLDTEVAEVWVTSYRNPASAHFVAAADSTEPDYPDYWTADGRDILAWRMNGDQWTVHAISADGSHPVVLVAEEGRDDARNFLAFTPQGKRYMKTMFPGGIHAFASGDDVSNIFARYVPSLIEAKLSAGGDRD